MTENCGIDDGCGFWRDDITKANIDLHRNDRVPKLCGECCPDTVIVGVLGNAFSDYRFVIENHAILIGRNPANRRDGIPHQVEVVTHSSEKINIPRRAGKWHLPRQQHEGSLENEVIPVIGTGEPVKPPFKGVELSQLIEWSIRLARQIQQPLVHRG